MKKKYINPKIVLTCYKTSESIANDNFLSDPWGFDEDLTDLDESNDGE